MASTIWIVIEKILTLPSSKINLSEEVAVAISNVIAAFTNRGKNSIYTYLEGHDFNIASGRIAL
ncbi:hypothetical protein BM1_10488 [Bipolaris maydis]|nr:hypothetical protein BM1_10488 [Bipolaris maydis]